MRHSPIRRLAPVALAGLLLVSAVPIYATPRDSSQHALNLTPQVVHTGVEEFKSDSPLLEGADPGCGGTPGQVGYTHLVGTSYLGDSYENCVYQAALRFDVSGLRQYPAAIVTTATLTYTDSVNALLLPDGHPAGNPYDLNQDAVWGSCVSRITVPTADWRNDIGLTPNVEDETIERLDGSAWTVTNQVNHWYYEPDFKNFGLLLLGYDEGDQFSNNASCLTTLSDFKLQVEFVASDAPTPTPTPNVAERALANGRAAVLPTPTPTPFRRSIGAGALVPTPLPVDPNGIKPVRPDLVVTGVETFGQKDARGLTPLCSAGQATTFTIHIKNIGTAATREPAVVSLSVDGVPKATATFDPLPPGGQTTVTIGGQVLSAGTHSFSVTVNAGQKIVESDYANNRYDADHLGCV